MRSRANLIRTIILEGSDFFWAILLGHFLLWRPFLRCFVFFCFDSFHGCLTFEPDSVMLSDTSKTRLHDTSMTPNTVVFPCISVHVKIMSLLLLLVADGSCKSKVFKDYNYIEEFPWCIDSPTSHQSFESHDS